MNLSDPTELRIVHYPDPVLREVAAEVTDFGPELKALADRMFGLMRGAEGVGLAAPQVGVSIRLFVCNTTGQPEDDLVCVNPRFTEMTGAAECEEGCLSVPGVTITKRRAARVIMQAQDLGGRPFEATGEGLTARVWQHENDHIDGRLILDGMSPTDEIANRRAVKQLKEKYTTAHKK